jgi:hypothetical protein
MDDPEGTYITTKRDYSVFHWGFGQYERRIEHDASKLPGLEVNEGFHFWANYCKAVSKHCSSAKNAAYTSAMNPLPQEVSFSLDIKDDRSTKSSVFVNNETVLDSDVSPASIAYDPSDADMLQHYAVGAKVRYTRQGHNSLGVIRAVDSSDPTKAPIYTVALQDGKIMKTAPGYLRTPDAPDIASIPVTRHDYIRASSLISEDDAQRIAKPKALTPLAQEFLSWHDRLDHLPMKQMITLAKTDKLPRKFLQLQGSLPFCASCSFGNASKRSWRSKGHNNHGAIRRPDEKNPGDCCSTDQLISAQAGLVPQLSGRLTHERIWAATIFIDHVSGFAYAHLMRAVTQDETLAAKHAWERIAATHGREIKRYHADNGRYAEADFRADAESLGQQVTYCGVGAHHQNGLAENTVKQFTLKGRTLLLHAKRHWPEAITTILWPFALKAGVKAHNDFKLDADGKVPAQKFSTGDSGSIEHSLRDRHTWGCPVFILDASLQSSSLGAPKWEPRSRLGIYLGHSPFHAGSVALVLNPATGHVSPQYHVVFDDDFTTVASIRNGVVPENWMDLVKRSSELATDEQFDLAQTWLAQDLSTETAAEEPAWATTAVSEGGAPVETSDALPSRSPVSEGGVSNPVSEGDSLLRSPSSFVPSSPATPGAQFDTTSPGFSEGVNDSPMFASRTNSVPSPRRNLMPEYLNLQEAGLRRSGRNRQATTKAQQVDQGSKEGAALRKTYGVLFSLFCFATIAIGAMTTNTISAVQQPKAFFAQTVDRWEMANTLYDETLNDMHHFCYAAITNENDSYTFKNMLQQPDKAEFVKAMTKEVEAHESREHWTAMLRKDMPKDAKTILSIWSFKRKTLPDGQILKYKARLCAHGGMQQWGVDYWETYAPVVNWVSVRLLLAVATIHDLPTGSIDFVLAFPQADLDVPVYMEVPIGMDFDGCHRREMVLKLNKSLYGLCQSSSNWFKMLSKGLDDRGFVPSQVDQCVFFRHDAVILTYVDDCFIIAKKQSVIDQLFESLDNGPEKFNLTNEGQMEQYLGVDIKRNTDGTFELRQPYLIQRILDLCKVDDAFKSRATPAATLLLNKDVDGASRKYDWNYRSAVGMLGYLQGSTRPDISMAVHQCARFNNDPKMSHERAIMHICRYLKDTSDRGVIYRPDKTKGLECYVDADFAGGWNLADADSAENVLSRTGFVIMYAGCPVLWVSKLQTEIALSTTEAEYIALSQAMREVLPFMNLLKELAVIFDIYLPQPQVHCKVYEDNNGCIAVAHSPKFTPRTKHIAIKYHHFRSFASGPQKCLDILPIDTREQTADIFTKPLAPALFVYLRGKLNGW